MENNNKWTNILIICEWITIVNLFIASFVCIQSQIATQNVAMQDQNRRTDKLYEMFCDLLKEVKKQ